MQKKRLILVVAFFVILLWSAINPHDYFTWFLEVFPAILGFAILALTYQKFRLTDLVYFLIFLHATILMVGGHYTYAEVPLGHWVQNLFDLSRNHYDRLGHLAQGLVPAMIVRELVIRKKIINGRWWQRIFIVSMCLALSAFYEFIEWWVAVGTGTAATAFLGTQGDVWDTHWDMFLAFLGAILALATLEKFQDGQMGKSKGGEYEC